ncbi:MAG TPA: hypothetical protein VEH06_11235 [Candidatus Bathyarchaeia archaeon]|nr:hypothetical protein [Candidatus Bathyarchaeia archaeon]
MTTKIHVVDVVRKVLSMERKCVILVISGSKRVTTYDAQSCQDNGKPIAGNRRQAATRSRFLQFALRSKIRGNL